jgi:hypothetical protein
MNPFFQEGAGVSPFFSILTVDIFFAFDSPAPKPATISRFVNFLQEDVAFYFIIEKTKHDTP